MQPAFNTMIYMLLAKFILNDLPHAAGLLGAASPGRRGTTLQQFEDAELGKLVSRYEYTPQGVSFEGRDVLNDAIGGHLGKFIFLAEDLKDYWVYDKEKAEVLVRHTIAHEYSHLMILYEGTAKYLPEGIRGEEEEEYLDGNAHGCASTWAGFTVDDIDKISVMVSEFYSFRESAGK